MPLDRPTFPGEAEISFAGATLTSFGCTSPALAVDDDPGTAATFGAPGSSPAPAITLQWQMPPGMSADSFNLKRANVQGGETLYVQGITALEYLDTAVMAGQSYWYEVTAVRFGIEGPLSNEASALAQPPPRFLRVDWGHDAFISRLRLAYSGPGAGNVGVDYESSLSLAAGENPPADIALSYLPSPVGGGIHEVVFDPPVLGRGVVFYPDAFLPAASEEAVSLSQIQVYQDVSQQGAISMSKPTVTQARVGCSGAVITPRLDNVATTYPFPQALASVLQSIQSLDFGSTSKLARETGGDSVHQLAGWETDRETKCKISVQRHDYLALQNILGGTLITNPANGQLGETQYHAPGYSDRAGYFSMVAQSTNGNPAMNLVLPKCKLEGSLNQNLDRDKTTVFEVDFVVFWDALYTRQDGTVGGIYEQVFNNGGQPALHS